MDNKKKIEYLPITHLHFDPDNPRLPSTIDSSSEIEILGWMLNDATIVELMFSIGEQGYFPGEPLLVVESKKISGNYVVVEGNRRLTAVKLLITPNLAPSKKFAVQQASKEALNKPDKLPVLIFNQRQEILDYLGYRHITGIKPWGSLAKAKYLKQLFDTLPEITNQEKYKQLAKTIGSRANYVVRLLTGYTLYEVMVQEDFFNIPELNEKDITFSLLTTAINYNNIATFFRYKKH